MSASSSSTSTSGSIPITIFTGALGAGKTTLLNHVLKQLQQQSGTKQPLSVCVILNEFALEFGLNNELEGYLSAAPPSTHKQQLATTTTHKHTQNQTDTETSTSEEAQTSHTTTCQVSLEEVFEFAGGCVCCSSRGDLIRKLEDMALQSIKFDHILLETTGRADPGPIAIALQQNENIRQYFYLHAIITVTDASRLFSNIQYFQTSSSHPNNVTNGRLNDESTQHQNLYKNETIAQIIYADKVILNKLDLLSPDQSTSAEEKKKQIQDLHDVIHQYNHEAAIYDCSFSQVDLSFIFEDTLQAITHASSSPAAQSKQDLASTTPSTSITSGRQAVQQLFNKIKSMQNQTASNSSESVDSTSAQSSLSEEDVLNELTLPHDPKIKSVCLSLQHTLFHDTNSSEDDDQEQTSQIVATSTSSKNERLEYVKKNGVNLEKVLANLQKLFQEQRAGQKTLRKDEILRMKGCLYVEDEPCKIILQGVGDRVNIHRHTTWSHLAPHNGNNNQENPVSILVFIGRNIKDLETRSSLFE